MQRITKKDHAQGGNQYVFCRIVSEELGGYIVEVFNKTGDLKTSLHDIINSPRLFSPIAITGMGIYKKRWLRVYEQSDYDKERDSKYSEIKLVMGGSKNLQLWQNRETKPITETEAKNYERFIMWSASHLERRIREALGIAEPS